MEKRLIATLVAAAFAGTSGVAMAGSISVASIGTYAAETIGGAKTATGIVVGNVSYTLSAPFAPASTQTIKYSLSGQKILTCPTATFQPAQAVAPVAVGLSADALSCSYTVTTTAAAVPGDTIINLVGAAADASAGAVLSSGSALTAKVEIVSSANTVVESNQADVAIAKQAISASWQASSPVVALSAFDPSGETSRVNVLANPVLTAFTNDADVTPNTARIVVGAFKLTTNPGGPFFDVNGTTPVTAATLKTAEFTMTVNGNFAGTSTGVMYVSTVPACTDNVGDLTISGTTATITGFDAKTKLPAIDAPAYICYEPQVGVAATDPLRVIPISQFVGSATTKSETNLTSKMQGEAAGPTDLYNLRSNGVQIDVRVMTTAATTGWNTVIRVINTGSVAAPVTATYIGNDGKTIASKVIIPSLAAGATEMLSASQVESALGVSLASTGNPPRLRITAPTTSMRVQAWVQTPNGAWFMGTPAQGDDANKQANPAAAVETR